VIATRYSWSLTSRGIPTLTTRPLLAWTDAAPLPRLATTAAV
jgi:hypothetical protein